jgi:predicted DNA binding protein
MDRATFRVTYPPERAHPIHRAIAGDGPVTRGDVLLWGPTETVTTLSWYDGDEDTVADLLGAVDSAVARRVVPGDGGTYAFVHQSEYELDETVLDLVADAPVVYPPPVTFHEDRTARFEAVGEREALATLHDALAETLPVSVERVRRFERRGSTGPLTDRQREALAAGAELGYYDVPRTATVADVAAALECAPATAGELLRKGEAAVVRAALDDRGGPETYA